MAYWVRPGCAWRLLPHDLPPWQTVYHYFGCWRQQGLWEQVHGVLRVQERVRQGRRPTPSAAILDSQSVKTTERGATGLRRRQAGQRPQAPPAGRQPRLGDQGAHDGRRCGRRDGEMELLRRLDRRRFPRLRHGWADGGYRGPFLDWTHKHRGIAFEVCSAATASGSGVGYRPGDPADRVPVRGRPAPLVVERTFAWLGRFRRLSKDYEHLTTTSEAVIYLAMTRLLVRRLTRP
jgi:putative transposase